MHPIWIDTHCHLDAPEFSSNLLKVIDAALQKNVQAVLLPAVRAADCQHVKAMANQYGSLIPGLVYTLGIHPLYTNQAKEGDVAMLEQQIHQVLSSLAFPTLCDEDDERESLRVHQYHLHLFVF